MDKIRFFSVGDFHGDTRRAEEFAKRAQEQGLDFVVICGDITHGSQEIDGLLYPFIKRNQQVLFIPGNHDSFAFAEFLDKRYGKKAHNIHGRYYLKKETGFVGVGGANVGMEGLTEDEIFRYLSDSFEKIKDEKRKILVAHVHPDKTMMEKMSTFIPGSSGIRRAIEKFKPDIALCCHVHEAHGLEEKLGKTRIINVGDGKVIEL
jgi:hypothetical protein